MSVAIYPGTFDPVTFGHIDIARRATTIFSRVIAVVASNPNKQRLFSDTERLAMAGESLDGIDNIEVVLYDGLIVDCLAEFKATAIIRGLRALTDVDYEFQMAYTNRKMNEDAETVFLMPSAQYSYLNSTMVKQIARFGGDLSLFVPECVARALQEKLQTGPSVSTA